MNIFLSINCAIFAVEKNNFCTMKDIESRHRYIREQLEEKGMIQVAEVAKRLGVTGATIRRDLRFLEKHHVLLRGYGNAYPVKGRATDPPLNEKYKVKTYEKIRIAEATLKLLDENDSFMVTSGSTIEEFVCRLEPLGYHFSVTPSIHLAQIMAKKAGMEVFMLGGKVVKEALSARDITTIEAVRRLRCDKLFFSCDGFDLTAGVTSAYLEESQLNTAMFNACSRRILLADSSKFGKVGSGKTCDLRDLDVIVTDSALSRSVCEQIEAIGVKLILV